MSLALHGGGAVAGFLFAMGVLRVGSNGHFERTYLVPFATWLLSALFIFVLGWFFDTKPPTSLEMFATTQEPPCCWTAYECDVSAK